MIVYSLAATTVILALLCLHLIGRSTINSSRHGIARLLFVLSFACFIYLYGCWVFMSVYLKYIFAFMALRTLATFSKKKDRDHPVQNNAPSQLFFTIVFSTLCVLYFTGTTGVPQTVNLAFPFKHGRYLVFQGGKGLPTNVFHYSLRGAVYAMDLIKLDNDGRRATHVFSKDLNDYYTFGDTLYSPCNGRVIKTATENPDNIPPSRERGPTNTNHILIDGGTFYIFMGHLKQNSVLVHAGDSVVTGQPLGQAGNSGFSLEPHLHLQVHAKTNGVPWYKGKPLYIQFNGRSYLLFQEIDI